MSKLEDLRAEREKVKEEGLKLADEFDSDNPETVDALRTSAQALGDLNEKIKVEEENEERKTLFRTAKEEDDKARAAARPSIYPNKQETTEVPEVFSPGEAYVRSEAYKAWLDVFPSGGPTAEGIRHQGLAQDVGGFRSALGLRTATERFYGRITPSSMRALVTSADASAGTLVQSDRRGLLETGLTRPLTIRDLVTVIPVTTDTIEYVKEVSRTLNAAPVAEATSVATGFGVPTDVTVGTGTVSMVKPEGGLTFTTVTDHVKTIAEWIPATSRILADAGGLRAYIDAYLTQDIAEELEDQIVAGSGGGEDFLGILNTPSIGTSPTPGGTDTILDTVRTGMTQLYVDARVRASALVVSPADSEKIERVKDSQDRYLGAGPFASQFTTVWGVPVVQSMAIPDGTGLLGDFSRAILFDRETVRISVGTANDDFLRNIVRILAEMRAGFGVLRPKAFNLITVP